MKQIRYLVPLSLLAAPFAASAAIDVSAVSASFADITTALTTVGGLIIGAAALAIGFKWVKGMIFS
jgi:hypothetical protein